MSLRSLFCFKPSASEQLAEIDGGHLVNEPSVFLHIERGLRQNPHGLAVISTHQAPDHLASLTDKQSEDETCLAWTYIQLHRAALRVAGGMLGGGVRPGTTILMLIPNGIEYTILLWTASILRLTIVSLDLGLLDISRHDELRDMIRLVKPSVIAVQDAKGADTLDIARRNIFLPSTTTDHTKQDGNNNTVLGITLTNPPTSYPSADSIWTSLLTLATSKPTLDASETESLLSCARCDSPTRTHSILFTSGTSGKPKGCPLLVSGIAHVLESQSWLLNPTNSGRVLQQAHNARGIAPAQTLQTWREGGTVVMTGDGFNVGALLDAVERFRVTFIVLTPAMLHSVSVELENRVYSYGVVRKGKGMVDCVRTVQLGGDAVTRDVLEKCALLFPKARIVVNHGMTEVGGGGAFVWPFTSTTKIPFHGEMSPVGAVAAGAVVRIWDAEEGTVARREKLGELHVCCGSTIPEYLDGVSGDSFYDEGRRWWFNTGDVGMMDSKGIVFVLGRKKDVIQSRGAVVMPAPIESCLEKFTSTQVCLY